jgi:hypothetical protein
MACGLEANVMDSDDKIYETTDMRNHAKKIKDGLTFLKQLSSPQETQQNRD